MKLELKHLAPYLPYGLKIQNGKEFDIITGINLENVESTFRGGLLNIVKIKDVYPILMPLSDLTKEIEPLRKNYFTYTSEGFMFKGKNECYTRLSDLEFLFKNHFDVFGLIEKGLAIDINTIKE